MYMVRYNELCSTTVQPPNLSGLKQHNLLALLVVDCGLCSASDPSGTQAEGPLLSLCLPASSQRETEQGRLCSLFKLLCGSEACHLVHTSLARASHRANSFFKEIEKCKSTMCLRREPEVFDG